MESKMYQKWQLFECLPKGWVIDKTCGSPLHGYEFCHNGKSILNGGVRALVKVVRKNTPRIQYVKKHLVDANTMIEKSEKPIFPAKRFNELARLKVKENLLKDIIFDLQVCELEGWCKKEYIRDLQNIINSFKLDADYFAKGVERVKNHVAQLKLF